MWQSPRPATSSRRRPDERRGGALIDSAIAALPQRFALAVAAETGSRASGYFPAASAFFNACEALLLRWRRTAAWRSRTFGGPVVVFPLVNRPTLRPHRLVLAAALVLLALAPSAIGARPEAP